MIEKYTHTHQNGDTTVAFVDSELKGKHRDHCLCYRCDKFKPGQPNNCAIAQELYQFALRNGTVTPVYECPEFKPVIVDIHPADVFVLLGTSDGTSDVLKHADGTYTYDGIRYRVTINAPLSPKAQEEWTKMKAVLEPKFLEPKSQTTYGSLAGGKL